MSNVPPIPRCFVFQSKQRYPMSILISVEGCGLSCFIPCLFPALRTSAISSDWRWHLCREGLPSTWIMVALSVKVSSWCKYSMTVHVTQSKQFQGSACYGNLGFGLWALIFWRTKLILKWPLQQKYSLCQRKCSLELEQQEVYARMSKLTSESFLF